MLRQCATTAITAVCAASIRFTMPAMRRRLVAQLKMPRLHAYVEVASPYEGKAYTEAQRQRFKHANRVGETFTSGIAFVVWPYIKVAEYLRDGSRHVRIRSFSELYELECPSRVVFETPKGEPTY